MTSTALTVSILSEDADFLRETSWWLSAFGYRVETTCDFALLETVWPSWRPDFLMVDAEHPDLASAARLPQQSTQRFTYRMLLRQPDAPVKTARDLEYAFDDAISKPLNHGEALARLRAGARFVEQERRARRCAARDAATGLLTRRGLVETMQLRASASNASASFAFALVGLDFSGPLSEAYGTPACDALVQESGKLISELSGKSSLIGRISSSSLAIALPDQSVDQCEQLACAIREELAQRTVDLAGQRIALSATYCMGAWRHNGEPLADVLRDAERTLQHAKTMGGSIICRSGDFDADFAAWTQANVQSGVALARLQARDVMTPFSLSLTAEHEVELRVQVLHSGADLIALVDDDGKYVGVLNLQAAHDDDQSKSRPSHDAPRTVSEDASFAELIDHLTTSEQQVVVLSRDQAPLGYVTCGAMASLLEPVSADTFREVDVAVDESAPLAGPVLAACV